MSDYDGDICLVTDNPIMINAVRPDNPPVGYSKRKAPNQKLTQHNLIKNDNRGKFRDFLGREKKKTKAVISWVVIFLIYI